MLEPLFWPALSLIFLGPTVFVVYLVFLRRRRSGVATDIELAVTKELKRRYPVHDLDYVISTLKNKDLRDPSIVDTILKRIESLQPWSERQQQEMRAAARYEILENQIEVLKSHIEKIEKNKVDIKDLIIYAASFLTFIIGAVSGLVKILEYFKSSLT